MRIMDKDTVLELLAKKAETATLSAIAADIGVSVQYLSDVLKGYRPPSDKVLAYLGLKWEIVKDRG